MMRHILLVFLTLAICFFGQSFALRAVGGRTDKSESNFFSSIGRIQAGARGSCDLMVLGSSITGRLPDRAQGYEGTANMGCDGGDAVDVLRAMEQGILPHAPYLIIEANTLNKSLDGKTSEIGAAMRKPWFKVGLKIPVLAAYSRPSAFFYSILLAHRIGSFDQTDTNSDLGVISRPEIPSQSKDETVTASENQLIQEVSGILGRLRARGSNSTIVWLPPARKNEPKPPLWILKLARQSAVPYWDLGQEVSPGIVVLTDGVHMDSSSAAKTMGSLMETLK